MANGLRDLSLPGSLAAGIGVLVAGWLTVPLQARGTAAKETTIAVSVDERGMTRRDRYDLGSWDVGISADGRTVAFSSYAGGLVRGDTNREMDTFVRDLRRRSTVRVSVSTLGRQAVGCCTSDAALSANGRYVAFSSLAPNLVSGDTNVNRTCSFGECESEPAGDVFVRDVRRGTTRRVSVSSREEQANDSSSGPNKPCAP